MAVSRKSHSPEQFLLNLLVNVFDDLIARYPSCRKTLCRDREVLISRTASEGHQFLTKALPRLGKSFDKALVDSKFTPCDGFKSVKGRKTPCFLQGLFNQLFDTDGNLVGGPVCVIKDIRQVLYLVYKMEFPYTEDEVGRVIDSFKQCELEISETVAGSPVLTLARRILAEVMDGFDPTRILPRHGPGSVASGEKGDKKWVFSRLFDSIHQKYPYYDYFVAGGGTELLDRVRWYRGLQRLPAPIAKVTLVPKDSRGPRLISMEPLELMWIQQGLMRSLYRHIEQHKLTGGKVNFRNQLVNRDLALSSSRNGVYATIDLKDASDRVSLALVRYLFPKELVPYFEAARSQFTQLPNGDVLPLKKFAPMGSAICFPVEALIFWAVSLAALCLRMGVPFTQCADLVYVMGDDIIVPTHYVDEVMSSLESVGLRINVNKCCTRGLFRESCGMDAYNGVDVTPVKISTLWSASPRSSSCLASYAAYANELAERGFDAAATYIRSALADIHGGLPYGCPGFGAPHIGVPSLQDALRENSRRGFKLRWDRAIQRYKVRVKCITTLDSTTTVDGWPRLLRNMSSPRAVRPDRVVHRGCTLIRYRWVTLRD